MKVKQAGQHTSKMGSHPGMKFAVPDFGNGGNFPTNVGKRSGKKNHNDK